MGRLRSVATIVAPSRGDRARGLRFVMCLDLLTILFMKKHEGRARLARGGGVVVVIRLASATCSSLAAVEGPRRQRAG
jgi:hypothetical protein